MMNKKTLAGVVFCMGASQVAAAHSAVDLQALELLQENRISYSEFQQLMSKPHLASGTWSNSSISDGTWSNSSISSDTWSNSSISDGTWSNSSISNSSWSNSSISSSMIAAPVSAEIPQPIMNPKVDLTNK